MGSLSKSRTFRRAQKDGSRAWFNVGYKKGGGPSVKIVEESLLMKEQCEISLE
jgi:hypothetical protein